MDEIFTAPISTLLVLAGIVLIVLSTVLEIRGNLGAKSKSVDAARPGRLNAAGAVFGFILIAAGVGISYIPPAGQAGLTPTPTFEPVTVTALASSPSTATPSLPAEPAAVQPVVTEPPTPWPALTLKDGCIFSKTWQAVSRETLGLTNNPDLNGCLSLAVTGIAADSSGVLHLLQTAKKGPLAAGIYTPIQSTSVIEFNLHVKNFYTVYSGTPSAISFAVAPISDPLKSTESARFKLLVDAPARPSLIYFVLADLGETTGNRITSQHCEYKLTYPIRLELNGVEMNVYINGKKMSEQLTLPPGPKVFWIGYDLYSQASADIEVTDLRVDGIEK
jgi:hypothetical protein